MIKALALLLSLLAKPAFALVPCTPLPFQLQNGQTADATQVMANYNFIISCLQNAAASGNNNDITALLGLTSPIPAAKGGTQTFTATAVSTGTPNAQLVPVTLPTYVQTTLTKVIFVAGFTNTAALTLQVQGGVVTPVFRRTTDGIQNTAGGEVIAGATIEVIFDGTEFQLVDNISPFPVGTVLDTIATAAADAGFLLLNGTCQNSSTFPALFAKMGSPGPGSCGAGQWPLPDARGRVIAMPDSGGSTNLLIICPTQTIGVTGCGSQQYILLQTDLPNVNPALNNVVSTVTDPGHDHSYSQPNAAVSPGLQGTGAPIAASVQGSTTTRTGTAQFPAGGGGTNGTGITVATTGNVRINGNVAQTAFGIVQPLTFLNKQIKY